ncbi:hypothetical protein ARMGADRAFT_1030141 [Armillaria gallica]|uniref:Uncharacterized protein n=1 Tax=Armillaria gallica TaxID=47427 RepID=A0A2H3DRP6_ARMGA|nr:hypothetical protein ARMGADRAFT_1030141 [Armillaria gallica]
MSLPYLPPTSRKDTCSENLDSITVPGGSQPKSKHDDATVKLAAHNLVTLKIEIGKDVDGYSEENLEDSSKGDETSGVIIIRLCRVRAYNVEGISARLAGMAKWMFSKRTAGHREAEEKSKVLEGGNVQRKMVVVVRMRAPARRTHLLVQKSSTLKPRLSLTEQAGSVQDSPYYLRYEVDKECNHHNVADSEEDGTIREDHDSEVQQEEEDIALWRCDVSQEDSGFKSEELICEGGPEGDVGIETIISEARLDRYEMVSITRVNEMTSISSGLDEMTIST